MTTEATAPEGAETTKQASGQASGPSAAAALTGQNGTGQGTAGGETAKAPSGADAAGGKVPGEAGLAWLEGAPDELRRLAEAKGWKAPADALGSYASLEKAFGAERAGRQLLVLPKDDAPAEAWDEVWTKLGRPEKAEAYGLAEGEGIDPDFAAWAGGAFLEAGLTTRQAETIRDKWQAYQAEMVQAEDRQFITKAQQEFAELKRDWGPEADAKVALGGRFAAKAGFTFDELVAVERVIGTRALLERFAEMGARLGEDAPPSGQAAGVFGDAEAAKAEIATLTNDRAFQARVRQGDREARELWDRLHQAAYPEKAA